MAMTTDNQPYTTQDELRSLLAASRGQAIIASRKAVKGLAEKGLIEMPGSWDDVPYLTALGRRHLDNLCALPPQRTQQVTHMQVALLVALSASGEDVAASHKASDEAIKLVEAGYMEVIQEPGEPRMRLSLAGKSLAAQIMVLANG